ncbi:MAG: dihydroflavonol-4-reductase [Flavobacteriales bacterium]|jgi:nucleoside-diphosphate-sugar epimerase
MILVTGGTGLVGSHLLLALTKEEDSVVALYRSQDKIAKVEQFFAFAKAETQFPIIHWVQADITDIPALEIAFKGITKVYHCAAMISFDPYSFNQLRKSNGEGTANVVNLCLSHEITKLVYLSSIATLAKTPNTPIDEENHWDPNVPNSVYAITKYGGETEVWRSTQEGLNALIFNPGIILGAGDYTSGSGTLFGRVNKGFNYYTKGGSGVIDVLDVVDIMIQGMESDIVNERFVLVAQNWTYKTLLSEIAAALDKKESKRALTSGVLNLICFLDTVRGLFLRKRSFTKIDATSAQEISEFSNAKAKAYFNYKPRDITACIERVGVHFKSQRS